MLRKLDNATAHLIRNLQLVIGSTVLEDVLDNVVAVLVL